MCEIGLDFDFSPDLPLDFALLELAFVEDFEGADEACSAFASEVDSSEFALSERFADLEHAQMEVLRLDFGLARYYCDWVGF